jgi:sugar lactone lactonase YvrE
MRASRSRLASVLLSWLTCAALPLVASTAHAQPATERAPTLTKVASFKHQVTGVTVSTDGRIFVNFPRWSEDTAISVAELKKGGELVPFPNAEWNAWRNAKKDQVSAKDHWVCVQSVVADAQGNVWVLDPAAPAQGPVVEDGPKLVEIDLKTNKPGRVIAFPPAIAPQGSYLNDVRFAPDGKTAYLTDSGAKGALIVVDLATGKARRVLDGDPSTQPDKSVTVTADGKPLRRPDGRGIEFAADGIALSPDGKTLYWQAIRGKTLYSIPTAALASDAGLAAKVETVGENGPADGLIIRRHDGRMYVSSPEDNAIKVRDLAAKGSKPSVLIKDARLRWPDTFGEAPDGTLYITTSHIQDSAFYKPGAPIALPTELWSFKPATGQ